jgi:polar amino acid transport system substrate-binding protein
MRIHHLKLPFFLWILMHLGYAYAIDEAQHSAPAIEREIHLTTTDWCPYACVDKKRPGIAHEYLTEVFGQLGIRLRISSHPWKRAIHMATSGEQADGLLTAVPEEAPTLLFTRVPTMSHQMCFFTQRQNPWQYQTIDSLKGTHLGIISGYAYGHPIDAHLEEIGSKSTQYPLSRVSGDNGIQRLLKMLKKQRIEALIEDKYVVYDALSNIPNLNSGQFREAGCLDAIPFFLALNPNLSSSWSLIDKLNKALAQPHNQQRLAEITHRYTQQPISDPDL